MADNTAQGGLDLIATDELVTLNAVSVSGSGIKAQRVKPGYGVDGDFTDVSVANGLPVDSSESAMTTVVLNSASPSAVIDTTGFSWMSIQVGTGMTGQTQLNGQFSNDQVTWFNAAFSPTGATSSGISTSLGITTGLWQGPIAGRFFRLAPTGFTSGTQTVLVYMQSIPGMMPSIGANISGASISSFSTSVAPAIGTAALTLGTAAANGFQVRATGTTTLGATQLLAAVATQMPYVTEIHWSYSGTGNPILNIVAAANALISQEIVMAPNASDSRIFRNPWKPMSSINNILNYSITGSVTGTWYFNVHGYYQTG